MPAQNATARRVCGYAPPKNCWNLKAVKLLLGLFFAQYNASWRPDDNFTCTDIFSFGPLHLTVLTWFRLSDRLLISQATSFADKACKANRSLGRMASCWKKTNWWHQASHEWGWKWSGWNWTNRTGGYGPDLYLHSWTYHLYVMKFKNKMDNIVWIKHASHLTFHAITVPSCSHPSTGDEA